MHQNTPTFPNLIRSLDKLKILVFWEILKSGNPLLLDGDYMPENKYTEEESLHIVQVWEYLYDSYFQLKNDSKSKIVLQKNFDIMWLAEKISKLKYNVDFIERLKGFKDLIPESDFNEKMQALIMLFKTVEPSVNFNVFDDVDVILEKVNKRISALKNKYNRLKEDNDKHITKQVDNIFSVIAKISRITGMQLNAQNMVVTEWIAYEQQAKEIQKIEEESRRKRKK